MSADSLVVTLELVGGQRDGQRITDYLVILGERGIPPQITAYAWQDRPAEVYAMPPEQAIEAVAGADVVLYYPSASSVRDVERALSIPESMRPRGLIVRYLLEGMRD